MAGWAFLPVVLLDEALGFAAVFAFELVFAARVEVDPPAPLAFRPGFRVAVVKSRSARSQ